MKHALIITTVSGFLLKFEKENVKILQDLGYTVHYASNMKEPIYRFDPSRLEELGITFHHIDIAKSPVKIGQHLRALKQLLGIISQYNIQLIHCHTPMGGVLGRLCGALSPAKNIRVIYTAHGFHFYDGAPLLNNILYYSIEKVLAKFTDTLVLINSEDFSRAQCFRLKDGGKIYLIPGVGLDMNWFRPMGPAVKQRNRDKYGISEDTFLILSVGELNENKNQYVVLQALQKLRHCGINPSQLHYGICGDGPYHEKLKNWIHEMDLDEYVTLYGYCTNIRDYISMADVVLFPSIREGLGMAAIESLAMGVPVIAADNRGTREYMHPGENGFTCFWNDSDGFAKEILRMNRMSGPERAAMGERCRESVQRFDKQNTQRIMREVYAEIDGKVCSSCPNHL